MKNGGSFHSYVKLPEGILLFSCINESCAPISWLFSTMLLGLHWCFHYCRCGRPSLAYVSLPEGIPPRKEWKNFGLWVLWVFFLSTNMRNDCPMNKHLTVLQMAWIFSHCHFCRKTSLTFQMVQNSSPTKMDGKQNIWVCLKIRYPQFK